MSEYDAHYKLTETSDYEIVVFEEQYRSLRKEILDRQSRRFWIVAGGALGVPSLSGLKISGVLGGDFIVMIPLIVVAISFLFVIEVNGIARAGKFIENRIENEFKSVKGWEHYLKDLKKAEELNPPIVNLANASFIILMFVFFIFSVVVSMIKIWSTTSTGSVIYGCIMASIFLWWLIEMMPFLMYSAEKQKRL